jgi:hypothetical protein
MIWARSNVKYIKVTRVGALGFESGLAVYSDGMMI